MKHLFASGEVLYSRNIKNLSEGMLSAEYLVYDEVSENTVYEAVGSINDKPVSVEFKIKKECYEDLNFKHMVKILMRSDLLTADWESYKVIWL